MPDVNHNKTSQISNFREEWKSAVFTIAPHRILPIFHRSICSMNSSFCKQIFLEMLLITRCFLAYFLCSCQLFTASKNIAPFMLRDLISCDLYTKIIYNWEVIWIEHSIDCSKLGYFMIIQYLKYQKYAMFLNR